MSPLTDRYLPAVSSITEGETDYLYWVTSGPSPSFHLNGSYQVHSGRSSETKSDGVCRISQLSMIYRLLACRSCRTIPALTRRDAPTTRSGHIYP